MIPLLLFILLGVTILVLFEWRARRQPQQKEQKENDRNTNGECCGQHLVCERELPPSPEPEYYDDEELDKLSGIKAENYSDSEADMVREVFQTLDEKDVPGWVRSIQQRGIDLPQDVREEALLIVQEQRQIAKR